tara:strand:- start:11111 stop:11818 length:708 start_codon:yes stop_codon:yes gene_type:complete
MRVLKVSTIVFFVIALAIFAFKNLFVSEQNREVKSFKHIYVSGPINVFLRQSDKESIRIRADNNVHDKVITEVIGDTLKIYDRIRIQRERVLDVYVDFVYLKSLHASGASTLTGQGVLNITELKVKTSAAAEVKLLIEGRSLDLLMTQAANVQLAGKLDSLQFSIRGLGDLMAYNLTSKHCKAVLQTAPQSPGIARINVTQTLDVQIKGPRLIKYKGNPKIINKILHENGKLTQY